MLSRRAFCPPCARERTDVGRTARHNGMRVMINVYDPLVRMDENFKPVPCVAESWEASEDGLEYTFIIKKGAFSFWKSGRISNAISRRSAALSFFARSWIILEPEFTKSRHFG